MLLCVAAAWMGATGLGNNAIAADVGAQGVTIETRYSKYLPQGSYFRLSNEAFILDMDTLSGTLKGLYRKNDPLGTNFIGNEMNHRINVQWRERYIAKRSDRIPRWCWTGDVLLMHRKNATEDWYAGHTNYSEDVRTVRSEKNSLVVTYTGDSANAGGFRDIKLEQRFTLSGNSLIWRLELVNTSDEELEIGSIGLPVILNTNARFGENKYGWNHRSPDSVKRAHEQRVRQHTFTSGHSSFLYTLRPSGQAPYLLTMPIEDTFFEANVGGLWTGGLKTEFIETKGTVIYLYSEAAREVNGWKPWVNGHRTFRLPVGGRKTFAMKLCWVDGHDDFQQTRYEHGQVVAKVTPGMVLPRQVSANMLLRSREPITEIKPDPGVEIQPINQIGDRYTYRVRIKELGEQKVAVKYGDKKWTTLLFYGTEDLETSIKRRAKFIAKRQQITDPKDPRCYGFSMWNNATDTQVARAKDYNNDVNIGGCDDIGLGEPLFLSEKNVYYPDPDEISVLDDFVEKFLYGRVQNTENFEAKGNMFGPRPDTWRRWDPVFRFYNYSHIYNIYYNMYRIARRHQATKTPAREYLRRAYRTALVSYLDSTYVGIVPHKCFMDFWGGNLSNTHAALGMWNLRNILQSLREEGMTEAHQKLSREVKDSWAFFFQEEYPLATEYCFDTAAYAPTYYVARASGNQALWERVLKVILAARRREPFWFFYGTSIRGCGMYTTPLGARALLDAYESTDNVDHLRLGYAGTLAVWSCVDSQGRGLHTRNREINAPNPPKGDIKDWYIDEWCSGELSVGLYGNLNALRAYLVRDPDFGLTGYGAEVSQTDKAYTLKPWDGLGVRATLKPLGVSIETVNATMETITMRKDKTGGVLKLNKPHDKAARGLLTISGMPEGTYRVSTATGSENIRCDGKLECKVSLPAEVTIALLK